MVLCIDEQQDFPAATTQSQGLLSGASSAFWRGPNRDALTPFALARAFSYFSNRLPESDFLEAV